MNEAYWMFDGHPRKFREIISRRKKKKGERLHCWHDMTPLTTSAQRCTYTACGAGVNIHLAHASG